MGLNWLAFLVPRGEIQAHQVLRSLAGATLREMHHVNGRLALLDQLENGLVQRLFAVPPVQRDGTIRGLDESRGRRRAPLDLLDEKLRIAQRGTHQHEA